MNLIIKGPVCIITKMEKYAFKNVLISVKSPQTNKHDIFIALKVSLPYQNSVLNAVYRGLKVMKSQNDWMKKSGNLKYQRWEKSHTLMSLRCSVEVLTTGDSWDSIVGIKDLRMVTIFFLAKLSEVFRGQIFRLQCVRGMQFGLHAVYLVFQCESSLAAQTLHKNLLVFPWSVL